MSNGEVRSSEFEEGLIYCELRTSNSEHLSYNLGTDLEALRKEQV